MKNTRIVVFGGVFDPVHNGHIAIAQKSIESGGEVVFLPEKRPYRKSKVTDYEQRLAMLKLATADNPLLHVLENPEERQTIKGTMTWLRDQYPSATFTLLFGVDVLDHIREHREHWPDIDKLHDYAVDTMLFADRSKDSIVDIPEIEGVSLGTIRVEEKRHLTSATIRSDMSKHIDDVPVAAVVYIRQHKLYNNL